MIPFPNMNLPVIPSAIYLFLALSLSACCEVFNDCSESALEIDGSDLCPNCGASTITTGDTVYLDPVQINGGELRCNEVLVTAENIRDLSANLMSDNATGTVYPGGILQGGHYKEGNFTRVTIPTNGGKLVLDGLSGEGPRTVTVPSFNPGDVADGIASLLQNLGKTVEGTEAKFSFVLKEVNSVSEFRFNLGLDARFPMASLESRFNIDNKKNTSKVMLQFSQRFYTISVEDPVSPYAFFRDGANAQDPNMQIGANNPPLYVKSVHYGRQIFFLAESSYSTEDLAFSLNAAFESKPAKTKVSANSSLTVKEILDASNITYIVIGGGTNNSKIIATSYEEVIQAINQGASWSLANPGSPIAYDLRYLANGQTARMAFVNDFVRKTCELIPGQRFNVFPKKIVCNRCPDESDRIAEFAGKVRVSTSQDPAAREFSIQLGVPVSAEQSFPLPGNNKVTVNFIDPQDDDFIQLSFVNVIEGDGGPRDKDEIFKGKEKRILWRDLKSQNNFTCSTKWVEQGFDFDVEVSVQKQ